MKPLPKISAAVLLQLVMVLAFGLPRTHAQDFVAVPDTIYIYNLGEQMAVDVLANDSIFGMPASPLDISMTTGVVVLTPPEFGELVSNYPFQPFLEYIPFPEFGTTEFIDEFTYGILNFGTGEVEDSATVTIFAETLPVAQCYANFYPVSGFGDSIILFQNTSSSDGSYDSFWDFGDGSTSILQNPSYSFPAPGVYVVCLTIIDETGCDNTICKEVYVTPPPSCPIGLLTQQDGLTVDFLLENAAQYTFAYWDFGDGNTSEELQPTHTYAMPGTYNCVVFAVDNSNCVNVNEFTLTVDQCELDCIWPGDTNLDGTANAWDLLPIGWGYGESGPARILQGNDWTGHSANDWTDSVDAVPYNLKHVDCNGDGMINEADIEAIDLNYGLESSKTENTGQTASAFSLYLQIQNTSIAPGDTVFANILVDESGGDTELYGLAFNVVYNDELVADTTAPNIIFGNSWLGEVDSTISITKVHNGSIDAAVSRINRQNATGSGVLGVMSFIMEEVLDGKSEVYLNLDFGTIKAVLGDGTELAANGVGDSKIITTSQPPLQPDLVEVYPNPASGQLFVEYDAGLQASEVSIIDLSGRVLVRAEAGRSKTLLNTSRLPQGTYLLKVESDKGNIMRKIFITE